MEGSFGGTAVLREAKGKPKARKARHLLWIVLLRKFFGFAFGSRLVAGGRSGRLSRGLVLGFLRGYIGVGKG